MKSNTPQCDVLEELSLTYCDDKCVREWKRLAYTLEERAERYRLATLKQDAEIAALRASAKEVFEYEAQMEELRKDNAALRAALEEIRGDAKIGLLGLTLVGVKHGLTRIVREANAALGEEAP
jgi:hypothetical protein